MTLFCLFLGITLFPRDVTVDQGSYAVFNCNYSCRIHETHILFWLVGNLPLHQRTFLRGRTQNFESYSGLDVEVTNESTCEGDGTGLEQATERLRVTANSAELHNRTAVQCVAYATAPTDQTFYSSYSMMLINAPKAGEKSLALGCIPIRYKLYCQL